MSLTKKLFVVAYLFVSLAEAQNCGAPAQYYRFWQGFKLQSFASQTFNQSIPTFMDSTVKLYQGKGLNNYLVAIPPETKPTYIPDEFALIAFDSEVSYRNVRTTPEGQTYADSHWNIFERTTSKSAPMLPFDSTASELTPNVAYNVIGGASDWCGAQPTFFIGIRNSNISVDTFRKRMVNHIQNAKLALADKGLVGYLALSTDEYEVAYMLWKDQSSMAAAFQTPEAQAVVKDATDLMTQLQWNISESYTGVAEPNHFYSTIR